MLRQVKVKFDGNHAIGTLPHTNRIGVHGRREPSAEAILFDRYYLEALEKNIPKKQICAYIGDCIQEEEDIMDWLSPEEIQGFYKNKQRNLHKRKQRYENKLFLIDWNYYVTFTYDDKKQTEESFLIRLKKVFSNFKTRYGWLVMAVPEEGEENGRKHVHAFIYIPEGKMKGDLFSRKVWSKKRKRWEFVTDNTYFYERFGGSVWKSINRNDLRGNSLTSYITKYLEKSGNKFFYSRGIPCELEMIIDTETDVFCTFYNYGVKVMLYDAVFFGKEKDAIKQDEDVLLTFENCELRGFDLNDCPVFA